MKGIRISLFYDKLKISVYSNKFNNIVELLNDLLAYIFQIVRNVTINRHVNVICVVKEIVISCEKVISFFYVCFLGLNKYKLLIVQCCLLPNMPLA